MTDLQLQHAVFDKLTIAPLLEAGKLQVRLAGICDSFAVKSLGQYLDQVTQEMARLQLATVAIDVTKVALLNSSSLKQFITFLRPMKLGESQNKVEFVVDDAIPWQRRCLAALARMCPVAVSLRDINGGMAPPNPSRQLQYASPTPVPTRRS